MERNKIFTKKYLPSTICKSSELSYVIKLAIIGFLLLKGPCLFCQTSSAIVDFSSTDKGILIPRTDTSQVLVPVKGLMIMDTSEMIYYIYNGHNWNQVLFKSSFHYFYADRDGDSYGDKYSLVYSLEMPSGFVEDSTDCDDFDEYAKPGGSDIPDESFSDSNCDGIDGDISRAIFVSTLGASNNDGLTMSSPLKTIGAAVAMAKSMVERDHIYVAIGTYNEFVILEEGISIWGGYDASNGWKRTPDRSKIVSTGDISNNPAGVSGVNIVLETTISHLHISTPDAVLPGSSNYGIHCKNCDGLIFKNNLISTGLAMNGSNGSNGSSVSNGLDGGNGQNGCQGNGCSGFGGQGGNSFAGREGGDGGQGGFDSNTGISGSNGSADSLGGMGGASSDCFEGGNNGSSGATALTSARGTDGADGNGFQIVGDLWIGENGIIGNPGDNGSGGGGGGGGGGGDNAGGLCISDRGGGGGGGGGGGEGGFGGFGGQAGGSNFGIFLINSPSTQLFNNLIFLGSDGSGGTGGMGGLGGVGGSGGDGGSGNDDAGAGGSGGDGGNGGKGGKGGKGTNGESHQVFRYP